MPTYTRTTWVNDSSPDIDETNLNNIEAGIDALFNEFDANTILIANVNNTPIKLTVAASTFLGRAAADGIAAMTVAAAKTLLAIGIADISDIPGTIASILTDHDKAAHDALALDAGSLSGTLAAARYSSTVVAAIAGLDPTFTSLTFDSNTGLKRSVNTEAVIISGGSQITYGADMVAHGGDHGLYPGSLWGYIGDRRAGKTPDSKYWLWYQSNGGATSIFQIDKSGNITTVARGDFSAGVRLGTAQDANHFDDASHGAASTTMYIGNKTIGATFTGCHYYKLGDLDLQKGESVKLINGKIYRTTIKQDKAITGIFWGITDYKDSMGNVYLKNEEIDEEYDNENDKEEITKTEAIEKVPITEKVPTGRENFILTELKTGKLQITKIPEIEEIETGKFKERLKANVSFDKKTGKFLKPKRKTRKQITNNPVKISDGNPATPIDFAYSVAVLGDSYEEHDKKPLTGAWVTTDAGVMEEGDFLCSSAKAGYLEKQDDDIRHNYTKAISRQKINEDTKNAYIELI